MKNLGNNSRKNKILDVNRFHPYSEELKNVHVGADSISAQKHRRIKDAHGITLIALVITKLVPTA